MSELLDKLQETITSSDKISLDDQNDLFIFLPIFPKEVLEELLRLFLKNPKLIKIFSDDFKARLEILVNGRDKWDKLIAQEEDLLNQAEQEEQEENYAI